MTVINTNSTLGVVHEGEHKHILCWNSIIAGSLSALVVSIVLLILASAYGLSISSPWSGEGFSAEAVGINAVIALIIVQWASSAVGGYLSTRFRRSCAVHTNETANRDMAQGFLTWVVATLITVLMLGSAVGAIAKIGAHGAAVGAVAAADNTSSNDAMGYSIDTLFRTSRPATTEVSAPETRAEVTRILAKSMSEENISSADKSYVATVVANRTGISQAEAEARIDNTIKEIKKATDTARKTAATVAFFTFVSLVIGAFIAAISGVLGGRCRDEVIYV